MTGILCALGVFLCFLGGKLLKPALQISSLVVGFGLGYFGGQYIGEQIGQPNAALLGGAVGAILTVTITMLALNAALFLIGALAGVVIFESSKDLIAVYYPVPVWGVAAAALGGGILNWIMKKRILAVLTALIGAWLLVEAGVRVAGGNYMNWTAAPGWAAPAVRHGAWLAFSVVGFLSQRGGKKKKEDKDEDD